MKRSSRERESEESEGEVNEKNELKHDEHEKREETISKIRQGKGTWNKGAEQRKLARERICI